MVNMVGVGEWEDKMHTCENCGQACDCDGEDTWFENYPGCACDCENTEDDDYRDDETDDPDEYGYCMRCGKPTPMCVCWTPEDPTLETSKITYYCVICMGSCEQAPTDNGWFSLAPSRSIHYGCLEHIWDVYQAMNKEGKNAN